MKKSVAITTIVALHAAVIGMLLIQGCGSEPSEPQTGSAQASGEIVGASTSETITEPKESQIPEGSIALRAAPTRPVETISSGGSVLVEETVEPVKPINEVVEPARVQPKSALPTLTTHSVAKGETLSSISKKYKVSLASLLKANDLNMSSTLKIGQELDIPSTTGEVIPPAPKAVEPASAAVATEETQVYIVKKGDSLSRIGSMHHMSVSQLMAINNLSNHNIKIGQKLVVAKGAKAATNAEVKAPSAKAKKADTTAAKGGEIAHKIASGETLGALAHKYGTTVSAIAERNSISDPRKIKIGQVVYISGKKVKSDEKPAPAAKKEEATKSAPLPAVTPEQPIQIEELQPAVVQPTTIQPQIVPAANENPPIIEL